MQTNGVKKKCRSFGATFTRFIH